MNKRITQNHIILASCCLLFASTQTLADRPAMSEHTETFEPEIVDISTTIEEIPVFEEEPALETMPEPVAEMEDISATETEITGDVIELQAGETLPVRLVDFPRRGMTMEKVRNELGQPLTISDTVGKPPITSWTYNDRVVYFEYSSVVHVVAAH